MHIEGRGAEIAGARTASETSDNLRASHRAGSSKRVCVCARNGLKRSAARGCLCVRAAWINAGSLFCRGKLARAEWSGMWFFGGSARLVVGFEGELKGYGVWRLLCGF